MPRAKQWAVKMRRREYGATVTQLTPVTSDPRQLAHYLVAVVTGIEDYLAEDETEVRWAGRGAEASGLDGPVDVDALEQVLRGVDPEAVAADSPVGEVVASSQRTVMGWEMSVAPPKSSSVLWAVSGEAVRAEIEASMRAATDVLVGELERGAGWSRRRVAGRIRWVRTEGLVAARVLQTTSRDLDPQLHEHIVVANLVRGKDDRRWRTLDSPRLYDTRPLASTVWGRRFRTEMTARLGVEWGEPTGRGIREIVGVPAELKIRWSQRSQAIQEQVAKWAEAHDDDELKRTVNPGAAAAKAATVTRSLKDESETMTQKRVRWHTEAAELGINPADVAAATTERVGEDTTERQLARWATGHPDGVRHELNESYPDLLGKVVAAELTERLTSWDRIEWLATAAEHAPDWMPAEWLHQIADRELGGRDGSWVTQRAATDPAGRPGSERWTTRETLRRERLVQEWAAQARQPGSGRSVGEPQAREAMRLVRLSDQQRATAMDIAISGRRLHTVIGPAGAGKTTTMSALAAAARAGGIPLRALAAAQDVTARLGKELRLAGIDDGLFGTGEPFGSEHRAHNITRYLLQQPGPDHEEGWWIIDEASQVPTTDWMRLMARADQVGATIIAVGDPNQTGSVGPGGMFEVIATEAAGDKDPAVADACHTLDEVWRMEQAWERKASLRLRAGDPTVVDDYLAAGRVIGGDDFGRLLGEMIDASRQGEEILVTAATNAHVDQLNDRMQGPIIGERDPGLERRITWHDGRVERSRTVGVGDLVRSRLNNYQARTHKGRPVVNGATWTVTAVTAGGLWAENNDQGRVLLDNAYLDKRIPADQPYNDEDKGRPTVELGYASTIHSAQGRTVDRSLTIVTPGTGAEALYVGLTRGKRANLAVGVGSVDEVADWMRAATERPLASRAAITQALEAERIQATREKLKQLWEADQAEARTRWAAHRKRAKEQEPVIGQLRRRRDQLAAKGSTIRRRRKRASYVGRIDKINEQIAALAADDDSQAWLDERQARQAETQAFAASLDPGLDYSEQQRQAVAQVGTTIRAAETIVAYHDLEKQRRHQAQQRAEHDQRMTRLQERQQQQDRGRGGIGL